MQGQAIKPSTSAAPPATALKEVTATQSLVLLKNVMRYAVSEVCFIRNLFPSACFKESTVAGTTMRTLCARESDAEGKPTGAVVSEEVLALTSMLETAFEALEKGAL